jgi:acyl carrier protein
MKTTSEIVIATVVEQSGMTAADVRPESRLAEDLVFDSLDYVELSLAIEEQFKRLEISEADAEKWKTVNDVVAYVEARVTQDGY